MFYFRPPRLKTQLISWASWLHRLLTLGRDLGFCPDCPIGRQSLCAVQIADHLSMAGSGGRFSRNCPGSLECECPGQPMCLNWEPWTGGRVTLMSQRYRHHLLWGGVSQRLPGAGRGGVGDWNCPSWFYNFVFTSLHLSGDPALF